jgi:Domain of unknown function (DUF4432)
MRRRTTDYLAAGQVANLDQFASVTSSMVTDGPAHGCRALDLRVAGGMDVRVLPDRGFDIGAAWYAGVPLAWISAVGEHAPLSALPRSAWLEAFGGGLVTTCGLRNVGAASEGHGLHGRFSHLAARSATVEREVLNGEVLLSARATIAEVGALGSHLRLDRRIRTRTDRGLLELRDTTSNLGPEPEPAPLLYQVNLGPPLVDQGARLELDAVRTLPRDADAEAGLATWARPGLPVPGAREVVLEHEVRASSDGWASARLVNERVGLELSLRWQTATLPRLHHWVHRAPGIYALALEPANCSVLGRAADRAAGRLPVLAVGEIRTTELEVQVDSVEP